MLSHAAPNRPLPDETALQAAVLPRYELLQRLGGGGAGTVYVARDREQEQDCAIKFLNRVPNDHLGLMRFKREFRAVKRIDHPNCVRVHDMKATGQTCWYAMEYLPGGSLADHMTMHRNVRPCVRVALQILAVLDYIHSRQIVHRDVKPQNILVARGGHLPMVKLADFGIAQALDRTEAGVTTAVGSVLYAAPEQIASGHVDPRADLYAVGVILYELLAGEHPLSGVRPTDLQHWLEALSETSIRPLADTAKEVPQVVADVTMRLLQREPNLRYRAAADAHEALAAWLRTADSDANPAPSPPLVARAYLAAPSFVGRTAELAWGRAFVSKNLTESEGQQPCLLTVGGDAGVGKSRFVAHLLQSCRALSPLVIPTACRLGTREGHRPVFPLLRRLSDWEQKTYGERPRSDRRQEDTIAGPAATDDHGVLEPSVSATTAEARATPSRTRANAEPHKAQWLGAVARLLLRVAAEHPCVVVVEDLQWADVAVLEVLEAWIRAISRARHCGANAQVVLIVTFRPPPPRSPLNDFLARLPQGGMRLSMDLEPFEREATIDLVASMLMEQTPKLGQLLADKVFAGRSNTPLFVTQALHVLLQQEVLTMQAGQWRINSEQLALASLPSSVQEAIGNRALRLSVTTQQTLAAAAVLGRQFRLDVLAATAAFAEPDTLDAIDEAVRAGFVTESAGDDDTYHFCHDRFCESLYAHLDENARARLHLAAARALLLAHPDDAAMDAELTRHFMLGGDNLHAYRHGVRAADYAMRGYAYAHAAALFERARACARANGVEMSAEELQRAGDAHTGAGRYRSARNLYECALAEFEKEGTSERRVEVLSAIAEVDSRQRRMSRAAAVLEAALLELGFHVPRTRTGMMLALLGQIALFAVHATLPKRWREQRRARRAGESGEAPTLFCQLARAYYYTRSVTDAQWAHLRQLNIALYAGTDRDLVEAYATHAIAASTIPWSRRAMGYGRRAVELAAETDDPNSQSLAMGYLGTALYRAGRTRDAVEHLQTALQLCENLGELRKKSNPSNFLSMCLWRLGDLERAKQHARECHERGQRLDDAELIAGSLFVLALTAPNDPDCPKPNEALVKEYENTPQLAHLVLQAMAVHRLAGGDLQGAKAALERAESMVRAAGFHLDVTCSIPVFLAQTLRRLALSSGNEEERDHLLRRSLRYAKRGLRHARLFVNHRPSALREAALTAAATGSFQRCLRYLDASINEADRLGHLLELGLSYKARGVLGADRGWPDVVASQTRARELLVGAEANQSFMPELAVIAASRERTEAK